MESGSASANIGSSQGLAASSSGVGPSAAAPLALPPPSAVEVTEETIETVGKKYKKHTSGIWDHFDIIRECVLEDGRMQNIAWAKCKKMNCGYKARCEGDRGTTCFKNHLKSKHFIVVGQQQLKASNSIVDKYRYDEDSSLRMFYMAIIMHEYPFNIVEHEYFVNFIKSLRPTFPIKSRITVRKEVMQIFLEEKKKLYELLKSVSYRFSTTMDLWTSNQNKAYMCVTLHWIDDDWNIQKRIVNFIHIQGKHSGQKLSEVFAKNMMDWNVDRKLFSITLDSASANQVAVDHVIHTLHSDCSVVCDGKFFHVRCANHILNLVAKDGLKEIAKAVENIRGSVAIVKSSPLQWEEFQKCALECDLDIKKGLSLDVPTRWNSTYLMLRDAIYYRKAFERLLRKDRHKYEKYAPSSIEWENASILCKCLKKFHDVTVLFSSSLYCTANLFFRKFCEIKILIAEWCHSINDTIVCMGSSIRENFDKYWEKSNMALAVATFLDPRYKKKLVDYFLKKIYGESAAFEIDEFMKNLKQLYEVYMSISHTSSNKKNSDVPSVDSQQNIAHLLDDEDEEDINDFLYDMDENQSEKTELDMYMAEGPLKFVEKDVTFDVLQWWKMQVSKFPILSRLAHDVLAMQVSTVASESAFSAGGRVVDAFRSRLDPEVVEALVCTKDWMTISRKGNNEKIASIVEDLEAMKSSCMTNMISSFDDQNMGKKEME